MEILLGLEAMPWDDESTRPRARRQVTQSRTRRTTSKKPWFVEILDDSEIVHWGQEPLAVPRRTGSADKSDALQTLRARGRVSEGRVSVWSACVFSAAFPRPAAIGWPGRFIESRRLAFAFNLRRRC